MEQINSYVDNNASSSSYKDQPAWNNYFNTLTTNKPSFNAAIINFLSSVSSVFCPLALLPYYTLQPLFTLPSEWSHEVQNIPHVQFFSIPLDSALAKENAPPVNNAGSMQCRMQTENLGR